MIAVFVNSMADTATFAPLFKDIEGIYLYNPTREELEKVLAENPTETFMCLGHGSPRGLFSADMHGFLLDRDNVHLLQNRNVIGIWCYASDFARIHNLRGFFTYMFISNAQEVFSHRFRTQTDEFVFEQNQHFASKVNELIRNETPMEDWVEILYESADRIDVDFVKFNYSNLSYFDGENNYVPQSLLDEERERTAQAESYLSEDWEEGTLWHDYCIEEEDSYIVCYIDNDGKNVWEEYNNYDDAIDRINDLYSELYTENADKIMLFSKNNTEI